MRRVAVEVAAGNAAELHRCWDLLSDFGAWLMLLYIVRNCIGIFLLRNSPEYNVQADRPEEVI